MHRSGSGAGNTFSQKHFHERPMLRRIVEHGRAHVHEAFHLLGRREHPAFALWAKLVVGARADPSPNGLAFSHPEAVRRIEAAERISSAGHPLAARAMTGHRRKRRARRFDARRPAPALARVHRFGHAATGAFTSATIFFAASPRSFAGMIGKPLWARMSLPCCTLVPSRRTTKGTPSCTSRAAAT